MTKKSKYLLLGVSGVLVGTAVVAIPVAVTSSVKNKEAREKEEAFAQLDKTIETASNSVNEVENKYTSAVKPWFQSQFNSLINYSEPKAIKDAIKNVEKAIASAENLKSQQGVTKKQIQDANDSVMSAVSALTNVDNELTAQTKAKTDKIQQLINSLPGDLKTANIVKQANDVLNGNYIITPDQGTAVYALLAKSIIKDSVKDYVLKFFNTVDTTNATDTKVFSSPYMSDRVLLEPTFKVNDKEQQQLTDDLLTSIQLTKDMVKARYADADTLATFNAMLKSYSTAMSDIDNLANNTLAFAANVKYWEGLVSTAQSCMDSLSAAEQLKVKINTDLKAAQVAFEEQVTALTQYIAKGVFDDTTLVITRVKTTTNDKGETVQVKDKDGNLEVTTTPVRSYVTEQLKALQAAALANVTGNDNVQISDKITTANFQEQTAAVTLLEQNAYFVLQQNFFNRAVAHANSLANIKNPNSAYTVEYSKVKDAEALAKALDQAADAQTAAMKDTLAIAPATIAQYTTAAEYQTLGDQYKAAKEALNTAINTFYTGMTQDALAQYNTLVAENGALAEHAKLYVLIANLAETLNKGAKESLSDTFQALEKAQAQIVAALNLYLQPSSLYPGSLKVFGDVYTTLQKYLGQQKVDSEEINTFASNVASAAQEQKTANDNKLIGLVDTRDVFTALQDLTQVINTLNSALTNADNQARLTIDNYLSQLQLNKNATLSQAPYSDATAEEVKALNEVVNKQNTLPTVDNKVPTDYQYAENGYRLAVAATEAFNKFEYAQNLKVFEKAQTVEGFNQVLPALPERHVLQVKDAEGQPVSTTNDVTLPAVAEYNPAKYFADQLAVAKSFLDQVKYLGKDLDSANVATLSDATQSNPDQYAKLYQEAINALNSAMTYTTLDKARYEYEAAWNNSYTQAQVYYTYTRYNANRLFAKNYNAITTALKLHDAKPAVTNDKGEVVKEAIAADYTVAIYQDALNQLNQALWVSNTAAYMDLQANKEQQSDIVFKQRFLSLALTSVQKPAQELQVAIKAAQDLVAALIKENADALSTAQTNLTNAQKALEKVKQTTQDEDGTTVQPSQDAIKAAQKVVEAAQKVVTDLTAQTDLINTFSSDALKPLGAPEALAVTITGIQAQIDEAIKTDLAASKDDQPNNDNVERNKLLAQGQTYVDQLSGLQKAAAKLMQDLKATNVNYNQIANPTSKDIKITITTADAATAHQNEAEAKYKDLRNTQALLKGVLQTTSWNDAALSKDIAKDTYTTDNLILAPSYKDAKLVYVAGENQTAQTDVNNTVSTQNPNGLTVRQLLVLNINQLAETQPQVAAALRDKLANAQTPADVQPIFDELLAPQVKSYEAALQQLQNYVNNTLAKTEESQKAYADALKVANTALDGVTDYNDETNRTFANYYKDTKALTDAYNLARYLKAQDDFNAAVTNANDTKSKAAEQTAKDLIDAAIAEANANIAIAKGNQYASTLKEDAAKPVKDAIAKLENDLTASPVVTATVTADTTALTNTFPAGQQFEQFMGTNFASSEDAVIAEFEKGVKTIDTALLNAKVAKEYTAYKEMVASLNKEITIPSQENAGDFEWGLLYSQKTLVEAALKANETNRELLQNSTNAAQNYTAEAVQKFTANLAKVKYDALYNRVKALAPLYQGLLNSDKKLISDTLSTQLNTAVTTLANATKPNATTPVTAAALIDAYTTAYKSVLAAFQAASSQASMTLQTTVINEKDNNIAAVSKAQEVFAPGAKNEAYIKLFGQNVLITAEQMYSYLTTYQNSNNELADDKLVLMWMDATDTSTPWTMPTDITAESVKSLIYKYASLFAKDAQGQYQPVANKNKHQNMVNRIYNDAAANIIYTPSKEDIAKAQAYQEGKSTEKFILPVDERKQLLEQFFNATTLKDVATVREALDRAEALFEQRQEYNTLVNQIVAMQDKLSPAEITKFEQIQQTLKAQDVPTVKTENVIKAYKDAIGQLQLLLAQNKINTLIAKAEEQFSLLTVLTGNEGIFQKAFVNEPSKPATGTGSQPAANNTASATNSNDSQTFYNKFEADKSGKELQNKLQNLIANYRKTASNEGVNVTSQLSNVNNAYTQIENAWNEFYKNLQTNYLEPLTVKFTDAKKIAIVNYNQAAQKAQAIKDLKDQTGQTEQLTGYLNELKVLSRELFKANADLQYVSLDTRDAYRALLTSEQVKTYNEALFKPYAETADGLSPLAQVLKAQFETAPKGSKILDFLTSMPAAETPAQPQPEQPASPSTPGTENASGSTAKPEETKPAEGTQPATTGTGSTPTPAPTPAA
ncbi:hypothetical protein [Mycoplasma hafezii]|uniref:hypothetical protein n=1 Tax=Mycoplasma hafezii TaxID=525886 RepID=UPI003CEE62C9